MRTSASRSARLLLLLAALALVLAACGEAGGSPSSAATVNGEEIPVAEVESQYEAAANSPQIADQLAADSEGQLAAQLQAQILTNLIETEIVEQGAAERGVEISDGEIDARRQEIIEEMGGQEQFDTLLADSGLSEEQIEREFRQIALREKLQEDLTADVAVSDEDVEAYFEANREERYDLAEASHVLVESEQEAQGVLDRLEAGEDFGEVAQEVSIDTGSGARGGELGEFGRGQMVPEFSEAVFAAEPGQVVGPIETQFGFHVIEVTDRSQPELDEVADDIRAELSQEQEAGAIQGWLAEQRRAAEVTVNPRFGEWDGETGQVVTADPLGEAESGAGTQDGPPSAEDVEPEPADQ